MKKGISEIIGKAELRLGEKAFYKVNRVYQLEDREKVKNALWKIYVKEKGSWVELKPNPSAPPKKGNEIPLTVTNKNLVGKELLVEAYIYEPEKKAPPGLKVKILPTTEKKIQRVELFMVDDTPIKEETILKYNQTIKVKVYTLNMPRELLKLALYEDDADKGGHNPRNEKNKVAEVTKSTNDRGFLWYEFKLNADFSKIANAMMDGSSDKLHEYYVLVESAKHGKKASKNVEVENPDYRETQTVISHPKEEIKEPVIEEVIIKGKYKKQVGIDPMPDTGRSPSIVQEPAKAEDIIDAYFAKKEYTKQTGETAGTIEYTFGSDGNKTSTDSEKEKIAKIILNKSNTTTLKEKKEYTTLEAIKTALRENIYNKAQKINIQTFKLGADFKKVNSAPLEDKLYLVARTMLLDGKQATITIKEKDGIVKGSANAVLPVLEITEAQMEQKTTSGEVQGTEKTEFTGTVEDGIVKIPTHLRPKSDDELKQWKEKLTKGKEDGNYTYTFASQTSLPSGSGERKRVAGAILNNAKNGLRGNPKIGDGKMAHQEDIENVLIKTTYLQGETINFKLYKKEKELLYLNAKAQGEKQHNKNFLKQDGAFFEVGKKCDCEAKIRAFMRMIRLGEGTIDERGYTRIVGGTSFSDHGKNMSTHPQVYISAHDSTAAGAYQITKTNWNDTPFKNWRKDHGVDDFSQESQDIYAVYLIVEKRGAFNDILNNDFREAVNKCKLEWASLPGAGYGQREEKIATIEALYNRFLIEELSNNQGNEAKLHIKPGFLKLYFDYDCCGDAADNNICPDDKSQCFEYSDVVDNPRLNNQSDNVNKNRWRRAMRVNNSRPKGYYHTGTDILALSGTTIYSMLCGTVHHDLINTFTPNEYRANSLGNYIVIKSKDKQGNDVYIKYCHLDTVSVTIGQKVKHGDPIGKSGSTGNAASVYRNGTLIHGINPKFRHIHIEAARKATFGSSRIDPEQFMKTKFDETRLGNPI